MIYCDSLLESGFSDWVMPTANQLTYASGGGSVIPDARTINYIWTRTSSSGASTVMMHVMRLIPYNPEASDYSYQSESTHHSNSNVFQKCRCVR